MSKLIIEKNDDNIDYLVLVNKNSKIPVGWESDINLIHTKNVWNEDIQVEEKTYQHYLQLKEELEKENITIELDSVYRSVASQQELWDEWANDPAKGYSYVKKYVAVPGYSEHHTGLAIDICLRIDGKLVYENDEMLAYTDIFAKIHSKLADYGFILRYPRGKDIITGYSYEPWHFRYVGSSEIAKKITNQKITLEEYLKKTNK